MVTAFDPKLASGTVVLGEVRVDSVVCVRGIGALHRGRSLSGDVPVLVRAMRSDELLRGVGSFANEVLVVRHVEHESVVIAQFCRSGSHAAMFTQVAGRSAVPPMVTRPTHWPLRAVVQLLVW